MTPFQTRIKFCGCTTVDDALAAVACGADAVGVILAPSPRQIDLESAQTIAAALPAMATLFAVLRDPSADEVRAVREALPRAVLQLHGEETPAFAAAIGGGVVKAIPVREGAQAADLAAAAEPFGGTVLFDTAGANGSGGTGETFAWSLIQGIAARRPTIVAGGLHAANVAACVRAVRPYAVDARSGVETGDRKDREKMQAFVRAVRDADDT